MMQDRETVIDKLSDMADYLRNKSYSDLLARDFYDTVGYALVLLKEQEAVKPIKRIEENEWTVCSCCKNHIISKWSFCPYCGRSIKWE